MGTVLAEGDLEFDFSEAIRAESLDDETRKMAHCMKSVDFIVEWNSEFWFVEVKNPDNIKIPAKAKGAERNRFLEKLKSNKLFSEELGPKIKDSFLYLHLQNNIPAKRIKYYVLIAVKTLSISSLIQANGLLKRSSCFLGPDNSAWANRYLDGVGVFNMETWNDAFEKCPVRKNNDHAPFNKTEIQ